MSDIAYIIPILWGIHGYATARENETLKFWCLPPLMLPLLLDLFTGNQQKYIDTFNVPTWQFLLFAVIAVLIIGVSWIIGYGIGKLQGD